MAVVSILKCGHCGTSNGIARCTSCDRWFVVTSCHLAGHLRDFETATAIADPSTVAPDLCDFCMYKAAGKGAMEAVPAGLRQRTCPSCKTEFLADHGF